MVDSNNVSVPLSEVAYCVKRRFESNHWHSSQQDIVKQSECGEERFIGVYIITGDLGELDLATLDMCMELHMLFWLQEVARLKAIRGRIFKRD